MKDLWSFQRHLPIPNLCFTCFVSELERSVGLLMGISDLISKPEL